MKCYNCSHANVCHYYSEIMKLNNPVVEIIEVDCKHYENEG